MFTMPTARLARASDFSSLLALLEVSEVSAAAQPRERAESIWRNTSARCQGCGLDALWQGHRSLAVGDDLLG